MNEILSILETFEPIGLTQMDEVSLMNRIDTKYVFNRAQLNGFLAKMNKFYYALEIEGKRIAQYRTCYYDTADFDFYHKHQRGFMPRLKIRCREYVESGIRFLEVKRKSNKGKTYKSRIGIDEISAPLSNESVAFINKTAKKNIGESVQPGLVNGFYRCTLVSKEMNERLTIDIDLGFSMGNEKTTIPDLVIAELKSSGKNRNSVFYRMMKDNRIFPSGLSKYCTGIYLSSHGVKRNLFKPKIRKLLNVSNHPLMVQE